MPSKKFMKKIMIMRNLRDDSGIKNTWCASLNTGVYSPTSKLKTGVFLYTSPPSKYDRGENRSITGASLIPAWWEACVPGSVGQPVKIIKVANHWGGHQHTLKEFINMCAHFQTHVLIQIYTCIHTHLHTERWNKQSC